MDGLAQSSASPARDKTEIARIERSLEQSAEDLRLGRVEDAYAALDRLQQRLDRQFGPARPATAPDEG